MSEADLEPRRVVVHELRVSAFDAHTGRFQLHVRCGGGTYVRTLIVDLARAVGSAAHMTALARTQHGPFCLDGAPAPVQPQDDPFSATAVCGTTEESLGYRNTWVAHLALGMAHVPC